MVDLLDRAISPAAAVEKLCALGVEVSERTLRERAREIGAYRQIGRAMFFLPDMADRIIHASTAQPSLWLPALVTFLFGQGSRAGETFGIDGRDDIDLAGRWVILRDTKNGHERRVSLQPRVVAALSLLPNIGEPGPLFKRFDGKKFRDAYLAAYHAAPPKTEAVERSGRTLGKSSI